MARVFADAGGQSLLSAPQTLVGIGSFAVAFWLKRTATPAAERGIIGTASAGAGASDGFYIDLTTGNLILAGYPFTTTDKKRTSSTAPALNTWVHVIVNHNFTGTANTDFTFYFDGKSEAGTSTATGSGTHDTATAGGVRIGAGGSGGAFTTPPMQMGPVALWSRVISPAEALALAGGAHPTRFKEGLIDIFDMMSALHEEGWLSKLLLIAGATNPTNAAVNPPAEYFSRTSPDIRVNVKPMLKTRARYFANGTGPISFNATPSIANWLVAASTVLAAAVSLPATPATQSWVVPGAALGAARTLAATPSIQTWTVPASGIATARTIAATPAIQTWNVPASALSAARSLAATPSIQTWTTPGGGLSAAGGATTFNATPAVVSWAVPAAGLAAQRTLAPTPAVQTWTVPSVGISTARTLAATPAIQTWMVPGGSVSGLTVTFTFRFAGGPVLVASVNAGGVFAASAAGGPILTSSMTGGPT